jgi:hypothetical protein
VKKAKAKIREKGVSVDIQVALNAAGKEIKKI